MHVFFFHMCEAGEIVLSDVHANCIQSSSSTNQLSKQATTRFYYTSPSSDSEQVLPADKTSLGLQTDNNALAPSTLMATVGQDEQVTAAAVDEDGDLVVARKRSCCHTENLIVIDHAMATPLKDVGLQVWRGCLLLCDFLLTHPKTFKDQVVLELGAGVGLCSIVAATMVSHVFCTDIGEEVLETCRRNIDRHLNPLVGSAEAEPPPPSVCVRELDWFQTSELTDCPGSFQWTAKDIEKLQDVTVILAADVVYDNDLTDAFFRTLVRLMRTTGKEKTAFLALERRLNFTIDDLDVTCKEYDHFRRRLDDLVSAQAAKQLSVVRLPLDFPQCFRYQRTKQLELWQIKTEKE